MDTNTESVAAAVIAAGLTKEAEEKAKAIVAATENEAKKVEQVVETKAESVASEVKSDVKSEVAKVEAKAETVGSDVKTEAVKVATEVKSKVLTTAEQIATLIKTHTDALNIARASMDEANKLMAAVKNDYDKVIADAEKAKQEAELFVAATGGVFKHIFTKIRSWF